MAHSHVAHNCVVGNHVIMAGGALLAGHVEVHDRAFLSGNCLVHQFIRVGTLAMMRGGTAVSKDLPPFTVVLRTNELCGLNIVGLRRAGISGPERLELKRLYHALFRSGKNLRAAAVDAQNGFSSASARTMLDFVTSAARGVCRDSDEKGDEDETESSSEA
jgi:UDP-N-acetylglucosamine acyltransferase